MLAQLLRALIVVQLALGLVLGYQLHLWLAWPVWSMVFTAALLPVCIMVLVGAVSAVLTRTPGESAGMWWRALFGEMVAGILVFLLRQPWTFRAPTLLPPTGTAARIPVVLVHGYLCNHRIWDPIAQALREQGHAVYAVNLEPVFSSIDGYAPTIENAVSALMQHTGQTKVALVGHSMGGLAIRAWMRAQGVARVARVLTLGTPHAGTRLAKGSPATNAKQMLWHSAWLRDLAAHEDNATRSLVRIALTPQDNIVYPQREQILDGITPTVFEGIGHVQMCLDPQVTDWALTQLENVQS